MSTLGKALGVALTIVGAVLEALLSIVTRIVLWIFVAAWYPGWVAGLLLVAIVVGPGLKLFEEDVLDVIQKGSDLALYGLAWMSIYGLFQDWRIASGVVGVFIVYIYFNDL